MEQERGPACRGVSRHQVASHTLCGLCHNLSQWYKAAHPSRLTPGELESVAGVFRALERQSGGGERAEPDRAILTSHLRSAMVALGLNPSEQQLVDIPNQLARASRILFADFCQLVLSWWVDLDALLYLFGF